MKPPPIPPSPAGVALEVNKPGCSGRSSSIPYVKNWQVYSCPSMREDSHSAWPACCWPWQGPNPRPQNAMVPCNTSTGVKCAFGISDLFLSGSFWCQGRQRAIKLAEIKAPAEYVVIGDSSNGYVAPYLQANGIVVNLAFANAVAGSNPGIECCVGGWGTKITDLNAAIDKAARHVGGSNLIFLDGHAKWYKADQIKPMVAGGKLRICHWDLVWAP